MSNNSCISEGNTSSGGEAAINVNTGSQHNIIVNNKIDASTNYSVYVATDSSYNLIDGNYSKNAYVAAFAAENDWIDTKPQHAFFSRPNYGDPTDLDPGFSTSWTYSDLKSVVFQNNVIHSGYAGRSIAALYVGQIQNTLAGATPTKTQEISFKNNRVLTTENVGFGFYAYEHIKGNLGSFEMLGNTFSDAFLFSTLDFAGGNPESAELNLKDVGLKYFKGNGNQLESLVQGTPQAFVDGEATPDASNWRYFRFLNTSSTIVTNFLNSYEGQEIVIRGDVNTKIEYNSALIRTKGLTDVDLNSNNLISFKSIDGIWYETWRSF